MIQKDRHHNVLRTDILFVSLPLSLKERHGTNAQEVGGYLPPLGIAYLAAYARSHGFSVGIIDNAIENNTTATLINKVLKAHPKVVGISALTPHYFKAVEFAQGLKKQDKDIVIILGGPHATIMPKESINEGCFDILVRGEGELTIKEVLDALKRQRWNKDNFLKDHDTLQQIKGIVFRKHKEIIITPPRERIADLDELPFPAWDLLPMEKYLPLPNQYKRKPVTSLVVIRGCPFNCSFCSSSQFFGRKVRAMSPERVIELMRHLKKTYHIKEIDFWDDMLTIDKKWMHRLCRLMISKKIDMSWTCYARVDSVDEKLLAHMKNAGCWSIFFGYESGSQELLDNIGKGITIEQIIRTNALCKKVGIEIRAAFMLGLPGETPELGRKTIEFAKKLNPDYAQFAITTPFPGTKLYADAKRYGTLKKNFTAYTGWKAVFVPYGYKNAEQIEELKIMAIKEFHIRLAYMMNRLQKIDSLEDISRYVKGMRLLAGFRQKKKR